MQSASARPLPSTSAAHVAPSPFPPQALLAPGRIISRAAPPRPPARRHSPHARALAHRCAARVAGLGSAAGWRRSRCPARGSGSCGPAAARRDPAGSGGAGWTCRRCSSGGRTPSRVRLSTLSILTRSVAGSPRFSLSLCCTALGWRVCWSEEGVPWILAGLRLSYTHASFSNSYVCTSTRQAIGRGY